MALRCQCTLVCLVFILVAYYCEAKLELVVFEEEGGSKEGREEGEGNVGEPLGLEDGWIPDRALTASSQWDRYHGPQLGRLNNRRHGRHVGGWSAKKNDGNQWLQVDLGATTLVTQILTQGRQDADQWVKQFTVGYSNDGIRFRRYRSEGFVKIFRGNSNKNTVVKNIFNPPITARYIQIYLCKWHSHISMRIELKGKGPNQLNHCPVSVDLGFVIDGSNGVEAANFNLEKRFVKEVISTFTIGRHQTHVGLVTYSNTADVAMGFPWLSSYSEATKIIDKAKFPNRFGQRIDLGLGAAYKALNVKQKHEFIQRSIVAIMNPQAIDSRLWYLIKIMQVMEKKGIKVFIIVIGERKTDLKKKLRLKGSDPIFFLPSFESLSTHSGQISNVICHHQYKETDPIRVMDTLRRETNSTEKILEEILV